MFASYTKGNYEDFSRVAFLHFAVILVYFQTMLCYDSIDCLIKPFG